MSNARVRIMRISVLCALILAATAVYVTVSALVPLHAVAEEQVKESTGEVTGRAIAPQIVPFVPDAIGWPQFMNNWYHTGSRIVFRGMPQWYRAWYTKFGTDPIIFDQSPVVHPTTGVIYVGSMDRTTNKALIAVNPEGTIRWTIGLRLPGNQPEPLGGGSYRVRGSPVIRGDASGYSLLVPGQLQYFDSSVPVWRSVSRLFYVSPDNGLWTTASSDPLFGDISSPLLTSDNRIFVAANLWKRISGTHEIFNTNNPELFGLESSLGLVRAGGANLPVVGENKWCDFIICFDTSGVPPTPSPDREPLSSPPPTPANYSIAGQIIVSGSATYSVSSSPPYQRKWLKGIASAITPTLTSGLVMVVKDGTVTKYNEGTGAKSWSYRIGRTPLGIASYSAGAEIVYFVTAEDGNVYAINGQGQLLWSRNVGRSCSAADPASACITAPAVIHGSGFPARVIVASGDGYLRALNKNDGSAAFQPLQLGGQPSRGAPAISEGRIYVAMRNGLVAVGSPVRLSETITGGTSGTIMLRGIEGGQPAEQPPGASSPSEQSGEKKAE